MISEAGQNSDNSPPLLELRDVHKRFGATRALAGATLVLAEPGTVHGLIGENGSGKSTLLAVLSGQIQPDFGAIRWNGKPIALHNPMVALSHGIAMVSQETAIVPDLTVTENILLGQQAKRGPAIDWTATRARAVGVLERLGLDYDPDALVRRLRPDQKQMIEIARAISTQARLLILDEPTSSLTDDQVQTLFSVVNQLKQSGVATIFVSHRMAELFELSDELTVLRDGCSVATGPIGSFTRNSLVEAMVGSTADVSLERPTNTSPNASRGRSSAPALTVHALCVGSTLVDIDLTVGAGEVVGIAGLVGAGRSELLETVYGLRTPTSGTVQVEGRELQHGEPRESIARGLGYLPPDRKEDGLVQSMSIQDNMLMTASHRRGRWRRPRGAEFAAHLEETASVMRVKAPSWSAGVSSLSGGNQQKVALGKWLLASPKVLLLDEPTRGVDIRSKQDIHAVLRRAADEGLALLVSSSENEELLDLCDRIVVMSRGEVVTTVESREANEAILTTLAGGHA